MTESNYQIVEEVTAPTEQAPNEQVANEAVSEILSNTNAVTEDPPILDNEITRSRLGFFSLPGEVRLMVYRQLFHRPEAIRYRWFRRNPIPPLLATCKLIKKEAFQVLWGENEYLWNISRTALLPNLRPRIVDTIQRLQISLPTRIVSARFLDLMTEFGDPARIRDTLVVHFKLLTTDFDLRANPPGLYIPGLGTFTNFKCVEILLIWSPLGEPPFTAPSNCPLHQQMAAGLRRRLGPATPRADNLAVQFQPHDYLTLQQQETDDWMDLLEGLRLDWNQDDGTNADHDADEEADKSGAPTQA